MNPPIYQRIITWAFYLYAGGIALGGLLGAVNDAKAIITPQVTYTATAVTLALWVLVEVLIRRRLLRWSTSKGSAHFTGLGTKSRLAVVGAILLLWVPRIVPSPASAESLKRLNAELQNAASFGAETGVQQALDEGADIDGRNQFGLTALMIAALGEQTQAGNHFPYEKTVKLLVESGADVNLKDDRGFTALMYAASNLCIFDSNPGGANTVERYVIQQHEAVRQKVDGSIKAIETLCDGGAEVNAVNNDGNTALMLTAGSRIDLFLVQLVPDRRVTEILIRYRAKTDVKNKAGKTALMLAEESGNLEITGMLRAAGAKE